MRNTMNFRQIIFDNPFKNWNKLRMKRVLFYLSISLLTSVNTSQLSAAVKVPAPAVNVRQIVGEIFTEISAGAIHQPPFFLGNNLGKPATKVESAYGFTRSDLTIGGRKTIVLYESLNRAVGYYLVSSNGKEIEGFALLEPVATFGQPFVQMLTEQGFTSSDDIYSGIILPEDTTLIAFARTQDGVTERLVIENVSIEGRISSSILYHSYVPTQFDSNFKSLFKPWLEHLYSLSEAES